MTTRLPLEHYVTMAFAISSLSVAGVATRIGILSLVDSSLFFPDSQLITVNVLGSFILGFAYGCGQLEQSLPFTLTGIGVGYCGSLTSFSSWINSILNTDSPAAVELLTGLSMPFVAFLVGEDIGAFLTSAFFPPRLREESDKSPSEFVASIDKALVALVSMACVLTMVVIAAVGHSSISHESLVASAIGPLGALPRHILAKALNERLKNFMLGTLLANLIAVIILGALSGCTAGNEWCRESTVGIAGSLSTVSSWVLDTVKIYRNKKPWAYFYCLVSVGAGIVLLIPFLN
jgi:fluoride ion exporter CrcB/FEX